MIDNNCVYPSLHNNSYADSIISGYRYGDVFVEKTTRGAGIACSGYANCYIGCSCNTSNGWYSSCQGTDCKSVTDTRYTGVNAMSVSNVGDVTSLTGGVSTQSAGGNTQVVSLSGGVSTMSSSGATTCYKKKTCSEGGYSTSIPDGKTCDTVNYNGYTCYTNCRNSNYTLTHRMTLNKIQMYWSITDSSGNEIGSGSELANVKTIYVNDTYTVSGGTYTVTYSVSGWVPCDKNGQPGYSCACFDEVTGDGGTVRKSRTFTVTGNTSVPVDLPYCGHDGCTSYPCRDGSGSGGVGIKPME